MDEIHDYNLRMIELFSRAANLNPNDPDLLVNIYTYKYIYAYKQSCLAVLHFIARDYEKSLVCFRNALQFDTKNYSLWNKLGATLAHLGRADEAIDAYQRALDLKPNYVRCWVNLGIALGFKKEHNEAIRFYLNALSLNPNAKHIWTYL